MLMHYLGHNLMIAWSIVIISCAEHIKRLSFGKHQRAWTRTELKRVWKLECTIIFLPKCTWQLIYFWFNHTVAEYGQLWIIWKALPKRPRLDFNFTKKIDKLKEIGYIKAMELKNKNIKGIGYLIKKILSLLLTLHLFQTCMTFFLLRNTKELVSKHWTPLTFIALTK